MTISNISTVTPSSADNQKPDWSTSLWQASRGGNLDEVKSIIKRSHITLEDFPGEFAGCFIAAGEKGHKDLIEYFLSLNAIKIIGLKYLVYGLESDLASEFHGELVDTTVKFIKSGKDSSILPEYRLGEVFKAALAYNRIKLVEAITESIDPSYLYGALESMLEENCIESEDSTISRYYGDLIKATITSLTPELSWKIIEMDAGVVNSGATSSAKVVEAVTKSMDPLFLYSALKSSIEKKRLYAKDSSLLRYYKNVIEITIKYLAPEYSYKVLKDALKNADAELVMAIIKSRPSEKLQLAFA